MFGIEIELEVRPSRRAELLQALESLAPPEVGTGGCAVHGLYEDVGRHNHFIWTERWEDSRRLDARLHSSRFQTLRGAVQVLSETNQFKVFADSSLEEAARILLGSFDTHTDNQSPVPSGTGLGESK